MHPAVVSSESHPPIFVIPDENEEIANPTFFVGAVSDELNYVTSKFDNLLFNKLLALFFSVYKVPLYPPKEKMNRLSMLIYENIK